MLNKLRNMIERLLYKPYPWGLLVAYLDLNKNGVNIFQRPSENQPTGMFKTFEEIYNFVNASKFNKTLENFVN
jgi:hypothetical protein